MKALYKRLRELELQINGDPLIVRFKDQAGVDRIGSVNDLEACDGYFVKVLAGSSLRDVDKVLAMTKRRAEEVCKKYETRNHQKADQSGKSDE